MAQVLPYINENPAVWTALYWTFAFGTLYLVYQLGFRSAVERGLKVSSWGTVTLLLGLVVSVAMFGRDYPVQGLILEFRHDDWAVFLAMFLIINLTYIVGYLDSFTKAARSEHAQAVNVTVPPTPL